MVSFAHLLFSQLTSPIFPLEKKILKKQDFDQADSLAAVQEVTFTPEDVATVSGETLVCSKSSD